MRTLHRLYTDIGLMTSDEGYANDVQEFFNVITGHSVPDRYDNLITAPREMRSRLIELIQQEENNAKNGLPSGIVIKINSLQDTDTIMALYAASTCWGAYPFDCKAAFVASVPDARV